MNDHGAQPHVPPQISVLIPVYNGEGSLGAQLDALASQQVPEPWEVIVSDNGSTDGTRDLVLSRREEFPVPLRVIDSGAHPGVSYARNAAIQAARADRIAICDADDVVGPQWLRGALDGLARHDAVGGPLRRLLDPFDPDAPTIAFESVGPEGLMGNNVAMRMEIVQAIGGFDGSFTTYGREDFEFSVRLLRAGADLGRDDRVLLYYNLSDTSWTFVRKIFDSARSDVQIWRRHPEDFPDRQGRSYVVRRFLTLPLEVVRAWSRGGARPAARVVVSLAGHARALLPPQRPLLPPMYLADMPPVTEVDALD